MTEQIVGDPGPAPGAGALLEILRDGKARTRAELVTMTGLARSTVSQRLDVLLSRRWIMPAGEAISSGGRPAVAFTFNRAARLVLAADLGATHARIAVTNLAAEVLAERAAELPVDRGPEATLGWLVHEFGELLAGTDHGLKPGAGTSEICGVGVGLPAPVEHSTGRPINPPIMPGWDGFGVPAWLGERLGAPVLVDNDVNIMALGEHWAARPGKDDLVFVKIGTGIGCGIITYRRLHRGSQGSAGDIGHIRVSSSPDIVCRCGNHGCLEAVAGGAALAAAVRGAGFEAANGRDVVRLVRAGNTQAVQLVRAAGREIGDVMASVVNFFNPSVIVIGGDLAQAGEHLLAGIREVVYSRSLPLATQHLAIESSELGDRAGVIGAAVMVIEHVLAPHAVDRAVTY